MLPQFSPIELLVVAVVALVVVGPRDLPKIARAIGGFVRQARGLARDFQRSFDEMGREIELDELRREVNALKSGGPIGDIKTEFKSVGDELSALDREVRESQSAASTTSASGELKTSAAKPAGAVGSETLPELETPDAPATPHEPLPSEPTIHAPQAGTVEKDAHEPAEPPAKRAEVGRG